MSVMTEHRDCGHRSHVLGKQAGPFDKLRAGYGAPHFLINHINFCLIDFCRFTVLWKSCQEGGEVVLGSSC
jgi:hypothetical protein